MIDPMIDAVIRKASAREGNRLNALVHRAMEQRRFEEARRLRAQERHERQVARGLISDVDPDIVAESPNESERTTNHSSAPPRKLAGASSSHDQDDKPESSC